MFAALGVRGVSVVAAVTAQSPKRVLAVEAVKPTMVREQLAAVFEGNKPKAAKTGMLLTARNVEVVAEWFTNRRLPLVVDPVMLSTSGAVLLKPSAVKVLQKNLLPVAKLVTPNVPEAEALTGLRIREPEDLRTAAQRQNIGRLCVCFRSMKLVPFTRPHPPSLPPRPCSPRAWNRRIARSRFCLSP